MGFIGWLFVMGVRMVAQGLIIKKFYEWFVVTHFTNLPELSLGACMGLSLFIGACTPAKWYSSKELEEMFERDGSDALAATFMNGLLYLVGSLILFGIGWVVHSL